MADFNLTGELKIDTNDASKSLKKIGDQTSKYGKSFSKKVTAPVIGGLGGITAGVIKVTSDYDKMAKNTKALELSSVGSYNSMQHAADLYGIENSELDGTLKILNQQVGKNEDAFNNLGIATRDSNGDLLKSDEIFLNTVSSLDGMDKATQGQALATLGLGRQQEIFNKVLVDGDGFVETYSDHLDENGDRTDDLAEKSEDFQDAITNLMDTIKNLIVDLILWMSENKTLVLTIATILLVLAMVGPVMMIVGSAIKIFTGFQNILNLSIWKNIKALIIQGFAFIWANITVILVVLGILLLIGVFVWLQVKFDIIGKAISGFGKLMSWLGNLITTIWTGVVNLFEWVWKKVVSFFKAGANAIITIMNSPIVAIEMVVNGMISGINWAIKQINRLPGVNIPTIGGEVSLPKIPKLAIGTDMVNSDGLAFLHKGEMVMPAADVANGGYSGSGSSSSGNIEMVLNLNVDGDIASDGVVDNIISRVNDGIGGMLGINYQANN